MASSSENATIHESSTQAKPLPLGDLVTELLSRSPSKPWSNPRKRPSIPSHLLDTAQHDLALSEVGNSANFYPQKRSRAADWPLRSSDESYPQPVNRRTPKTLLSPGQKHNQSIKPRPSKFLEGSMNDRVSTKPPSIYTRDDEAMERYHSQSLRDCGDMDNDKTYYDAGIQTAKPSGMYRFGKALVSAFNPVNMWQGINGIWRDKEEQSHPDKSALQDRKINAEKAYAELKKNGFKGTKPFSFPAATIDRSNVNGRRSHEHSLASSLRDSGVDVDVSHASNTVQHGQPTPTGSEDLLMPPSLPQPPPAESLPTQADGGRKSSLNISRPSLQSLKKVKSHIQLSSTKRKGPDAASSSPKSKFGPGQDNGPGLRRQPSKKDIAKQKKLSKQVSDLERKLEAARHELQLFRGQIPNVPKIPKSSRQSFKPGALPFLPSESILDSTQVGVEQRDSERRSPSSLREQNDTSTPKKPATKASIVRTSKTKDQHVSDKQETVVTSSGKKRKSSGGQAADRSYKPERNPDDSSDTDRSASSTRILRARKSQKTGKSSTYQTVGSTSRQSPANAAKSLRTLRPTTQKSMPLLPTGATPFDPAKVDKDKLLAMRSVPVDNLPFGSHLDDIVNLQKEFPTCSQKQIDEYLSSLPGSDQAVQRASAGHQHDIPSVELPSSRSGDTHSPTRQACKASSPNKALGKDLSTIDEAITVDPSKDKSIPPMPVSPIKTTLNTKTANGVRRMNMDKPLPGIQKENYNWPEDVF
ncbi:MAG: hypothetical protein Q9201_005640 [Fulgogasparrea decipioides]